MRSITNRAMAKLNKSLNIISGILAVNEELRKLLYYPNDTFDDSLELVDKKETMKKCIDIVAHYPSYMESIGGFLVIGVPEAHANEENPAYMDIILTIDVLIEENSEKFGVGLRALEIIDLLDYLLNGTDIQGIGLLKLTDINYQVYTPTVKGYTVVFSNRDMK